MNRNQTGTGRVEFVRGDIAAQPDMDAVVNAANAALGPGSGVAGALHRVAGPALAAACRPHAPLAPGQAVITDAFGLPNRRVIHCLGPVYGRDRPAAHLLAQCYREALRLAEAEGLGSIAFPALSTGAFGYPVEAATEIALGSIAASMPQLHSIQCIRFVLASEAVRRLHEEIWRSLNP